MLLFLLLSLPAVMATAQREGQPETTFFRKTQKSLVRERKQAQRTGQARPLGLRETPVPSPQMVVKDGTRIYGNLIYADNWTEQNQPCGIYSFEPKSSLTLKPEAVASGFYATGGGTWVEGKYVFVDYVSFMGVIMSNMYVFDSETWQQLSDAYVDPGCIATDMTWDPTTGNVYGCFYNDDLDAMVFGTLDMEQGKRHIIADLNRIFIVIAANRKGEIYGVGEDGLLYRFDKQNGETTIIGSTGLTPLYLSSGCFVPGDDETLYYAFAGNESALYAIDIHTAKATRIHRFDHAEDFVAMYSPIPSAEDLAPASVSNLRTTFEGLTLTGSVTFTMPTKTYDGHDLSGTQEWHVYINDQEAKTGLAQPGEAVSTSISVSQPGEYKISVRAGNKEGLGPVAKVNAWAGPDQPAAPLNIVLKKTDSTRTMTVTWEAPDTTQHGGHMPAEIRYDVVRMPDSVTVATNQAECTFSEVVEESAYRQYWYNIVVRCQGTVGEPSVGSSNKVLMGQALKMPYFNDFSGESSFDLLTVLDVAGDARTWGWNSVWESAYCYFNLELPKNDWLILPPMHYDNKHVYLLDFDARANDVKQPEKLKVCLGDDVRASRMRTTILPTHTFTNDVPEHQSVVFKVATENDYYMGFQACSDVDMWWIFLDNISVKEGPLIGAPAAVDNLDVAPYRDGQTYAHITFSVPSLTADGAEMTGVSGVHLYRGDKLIHTFKAAAAGDKLSHVDFSAENGMNTYRAVAFNEVGDGLEVSMSVYCGLDIPTEPVNVKLTETEDGTVHISWEAPVRGAHDAYLDPDGLKYYVIRLNDQTLVGDGIEGLSFDDVVPTSEDGQQQFVAYGIYAASDAGLGSEPAMTESICVGQPHALPFHESFAGHDIEAGPWDYTIDMGTADWSVKSEGGSPAAVPMDDDKGFVTFIPDYEESNGTLISSKIDLREAVDPIFRFWYFAKPGTGDRIYVKVQPKNGELQTVHTVTLNNASAAQKWTQVIVSLKEFVGQEVQVGFQVHSVDGMNDTHFDNINVVEKYTTNLAVTGIEVPEKLIAYEKNQVDVTVMNNGVFAPTQYEVSLYNNGKLIGQQDGVQIGTDEKHIFTFEVTPDVTMGTLASLTATVSLADDRNKADDSFGPVEVEIQQPMLPQVTDLAAEADGQGGVVLSWGEPDLEAAQMELSLVGFNVYCNDKKVNDELVEDFTWTGSMGGKNDVYTVTAVYEQGESAYSNAVTVTIPDGIAAMKAQAEARRFDISGRQTDGKRRGILITGTRKIITK